MSNLEFISLLCEYNIIDVEPELKEKLNHLTIWDSDGWNHIGIWFDKEGNVIICD